MAASVDIVEDEYDCVMIADRSDKLYRNNVLIILNIIYFWAVLKRLEFGYYYFGFAKF